MSRVFTYAQLDARMRLLGDYANSTGDYSEAGSFMSSGSFLVFLDQATEAAWNAYTAADAGFGNERYIFSTTGSVSLYPLPTDFRTLRAIQVQSDTAGNGWVPLRQATVDDDTWTGQSAPVGMAFAYRFLGDQIELVPTPGDSRQVRLTYVPHSPVVSDPRQTIDGVDGFDQVVVLRALIMARIREEKPYEDFAQQLADYEAQFRESAKRRDRATPNYTRDRRDGALGRRVGSFWR